MDRRIGFALVTASLALACTRGENAGGGTGTGSTPSGGTTASTTPMPLASSVAPPATASASASAAPSASASAAPARTVARPDGGKNAVAGTTAARARIDGKNFALDVASPGCRTNEDCALTITLSVAGDYHVNKEYPYKFTATPAPAVTYLGKTDANTFSKAAGDFVEQGEKSAIMTVRFRPTAPGDVRVAGTYKMSVCSAEQCQIEQQQVSLAVPVM
jgi:hypothetical protein